MRAFAPQKAVLRHRVPALGKFHMSPEPRKSSIKGKKKTPPFDPKVFLSKITEGHTVSNFSKDEIVYTQGEPADSVFYVHKGKAKITVLSEQGKEAVVGLLGIGDFFGEGCLAAQPRRMATASAMTDCRHCAHRKGGRGPRDPRTSRRFPSCLSPTFWPAISGSRRTWSISCSIRVKSGWRVFFCCWRISARRVSPNRSSPRSARRRWRR